MTSTLNSTTCIAGLAPASGDPVAYGTVLVLVDDGVLVGGSWARNRFAEHGHPRMPVWCWETLAIRDTHRGHHYGTQLIEATISRAADSGVELIYGVCAPRVVGFHQHNGFNAGELGQTLLVTSPVGVVAH